MRLLVLSREQYQAAMMTAQGGQVDARTAFLGRVDLFREAQDDMLVNLGGGCAEGEYKAGTVRFVRVCGCSCVAGDAIQAYTALLQRILSAGQENDMLYFVTSGSCRESVVTTQQEVAAKQARLKALAKDVHRKAPLYVPPPHPTRANTLKEQLAATGRSSLAGPSGVERASYTQLVPMYVPASPLALPRWYDMRAHPPSASYTDGDAATGGSALDDRPDVGDEDGSTTPVDGAAWGNLRGFVSHSLLQRHVVDVGVGQAFGDVAALLSIRQPTDVTAHTDVTVLSISKVRWTWCSACLVLLHRPHPLCRGVSQNAFRTRVSRAIIRRATDIAVRLLRVAVRAVSWRMLTTRRLTGVAFCAHSANERSGGTTRYKESRKPLNKWSTSCTSPHRLCYPASRFCRRRCSRRCIAAAQHRLSTHSRTRWWDRSALWLELEAHKRAS